MEFKVIRPFGPSVAKVTIPDDLINKLNIYVDKVISDEKKSNQLNHGNDLVGDVTQEFNLEKKTIEETGWGNFLKNAVNEWIKFDTKKNISKFEIDYSWVVRQFENEYNPTHWHSGHISGAGFLKVPSFLGEHVQNKTSREYRGGNLQLIHGARIFMCPSTLNIIPRVGDLYLFPNYLMHTVFPFKGTDEERRSISFNANIDENIYNVYG